VGDQKCVIMAVALTIDLFVCWQLNSNTANDIKMQQKCLSEVSVFCIKFFVCSNGTNGCVDVTNGGLVNFASGCQSRLDKSSVAI